MSAVMFSARCRRFGMLLRRELWEHRGSLVWAPLIVAGIEALLMLFGVLLAGFKIGEEGRGKLDLITISGDVTFAMLLDPANYTPDLLQGMVVGMNQNLIITPMPVFVTLAFAVFFYCLGALYDDRRDRSVLFWSSLPVREVETVLSKVLTATLIAPTIAMLAAIGVIAVSLLTQAILIVQLGGEPLPLLWLTTNPFRIVLAQLVALPVYALWTLPAVGWLLIGVCAQQAVFVGGDGAGADRLVCEWGQTVRDSRFRPVGRVARTRTAPVRPSVPARPDLAGFAR